MPRRRRPFGLRHGAARRRPRAGTSASGHAAAASRSGQRSTAPADHVERQPGVEGDRPRRPAARRRGRASTLQVVAEARGQLAQHPPARARLALARDRGAQALHAAVGVHERALLLGVALGREDHVRVLAQALGEERRVGDHRGRAIERGRPGGAIAPSATGSAWTSQRALRSPAAAAAAMPAVSRPARSAGTRPGPRVGQHADLAQAAAVGRRSATPSSPAPAVSRRPRPPASFSSAATAASATAQHALAVEDDDVLAGGAQHRGDALDGLRRGARAARGAGDVPAEQRGGQRARRSAPSPPGAIRAIALAFGSSDDGRAVATASCTPWRRTPLRMRRSRIGTSSTGSVPRTRTAWANSRSGTDACSAGACSAARASRESASPVRESMSAAPSASRAMRWTRKPSSLVVSPPTSAADVAAGALQRRGRLVERALPGDRAQLAAVAQQRARQALLDVDRLVGEAALVAEPAVVDVVVVARQDAQDALVADGELDVALRRAERADRAGVLDVPRPRAEAVGLRRQRADRAQLDDVAAERRDVRVAVEGRRRTCARRARGRRAGSPRLTSCEKRTQR